MLITDADKKAILTLKMLAIDGVEKAKSGHPGAPLGCSDMAYVLWKNHLRFNPKEVGWRDRDRFVLSNGHASMMIYSLLHLFGYDLPLSELQRFRQIGSKTPGHPEHGLTSGVEVTTGPLGQGIAHAVGMAIAGKMMAARFPKNAQGFSPASWRVWTICGDGCLQEGVSSEAASLAGHWKLDNLTLLWDDNHITIDGDTKLSFTEDVCKRFESYGWHTERVDGFDHEAIDRALAAAKTRTGQPTLIAARTIIGKGAPNKQGTRHVHGEPLGAEEMKKTKDGFGWPQEPTFLIPDDAKATFAGIVEGKKKEHDTWQKSYAAWKSADAAGAARYESHFTQALPEDFDAQLVAAVGDKEAASRAHSGAALQKASALMPALVGGSADLAPSNNSMIEGPKDGEWPKSVQASDYAEKNFHFGIREHAMIAIVNGMTLTGAFRAYGASFLIFTDYARPAIRLGSLMNIPAIYPFTHDSVFLGEDGPTHQPIEHYATLRAIPNLNFFRPADGLETAMAWAWAISTKTGPTIFGLTRQKLAAINRPASFNRRDVWKGGYVAYEPAGAPDAVVISTGSEVAPSIAAAQTLGAKGKKIRVVSMPCTTLFDAQTKEYRESVLPPKLPTAAVEAGHPMTWFKYTGRDGLVHGISTFGESAPASDVAKHFGFTPEAIAARLEGWLAARG